VEEDDEGTAREATQEGRAGQRRHQYKNTLPRSVGRQRVFVIARALTRREAWATMKYIRLIVIAGSVYMRGRWR